MPNLPYQSAGWNTHIQAGPAVYEYPLLDKGCALHNTVLRTREGPLATYATEALDNPDIGIASSYLVWQGPLQGIDGGQIRYQRLYSNVPESWVDPGESYGYTFPGYSAGASSAAVAVNAIVVSGANLIFTLAATAGASAGDSVSISVTYTRNGKVQAATLTGLAVATTNSSQITLVRTFPGSGAFSSVSGTAAKVIPGATAARTLVGGCRILYDYALSSDSTVNTDLPIFPQFAPLNSAGEATDILTSTTTPTATEYRALVNSGGELVAECVRKRYLGNIYVRMTRMVPAQ